MIPPFDEHGYLPPGIHPATLDEIDAVFGHQTEVRRVEMESIRWLVALAQAAGALRLVINGSFTTSAQEPNDVDCVLLIGPDFPHDADAEEELLSGLPFVGLQLVQEPRFEIMVNTIFASDRYYIPKGMIEVLL